MNAPIQTFMALAALAAAAGCGTTPYSQIDGARYSRAAIDTHPVLVTRIDGRSTPFTTPVRVDPGMRTVQVQTYPGLVDRFGTEKTFRMEVKPCTLYHLVAVKPNSLLRDFEVKVDYEEPVPGCAPPAAR